MRVTAYQLGFMSKCAELGVHPYVAGRLYFLKVAQDAGTSADDEYDEYLPGPGPEYDGEGPRYDGEDPEIDDPGDTGAEGQDFSLPDSQHQTPVDNGQRPITEAPRIRRADRRKDLNPLNLGVPPSDAPENLSRDDGYDASEERLMWSPGRLKRDTRFQRPADFDRIKAEADSQAQQPEPIQDDPWAETSGHYQQGGEDPALWQPEKEEYPDAYVYERRGGRSIATGSARKPGRLLNEYRNAWANVPQPLSANVATNASLAASGYHAQRTAVPPQGQHASAPVYQSAPAYPYTSSRPPAPRAPVVTGGPIVGGQGGNLKTVSVDGEPIQGGVGRPGGQRVFVSGDPIVGGRRRR